MNGLIGMNIIISMIYTLYTQFVDAMNAVKSLVASFCKYLNVLKFTSQPFSSSSFRPVVYISCFLLIYYQDTTDGIPSRYIVPYLLAISPKNTLCTCSGRSGGDSGGEPYGAGCSKP